MILLLDHANAIIVGGFIFLMIIALQSRVQAISLEQTANYMLKTQSSDLANWMEEDLLTLGRNMDPAKAAFANPVDSAGLTIAFTFFRDSLDTDVEPPDTMRVETRYRLIKTGTKEVNGEDIPVYQLARESRYGGGGWLNEGGSSALLGSFKVDMLDGDAQPVADPANNVDHVRNTRVRFSMVTPFETARTAVRRAYYGSTLLIGK